MANTEADLTALCSLDDTTRLALYRHVAARREPVTRDAAAAAVGVDRAVAAYHLDRLVAEGLLIASFARPAGRSGPGAGRPSKRYERSDAEISVTLPARSYEVLADLLATAIENDETGAVRAALEGAATRLGERLAADEKDVPAVLAAEGFEPYDDQGVVRLGNCPFHKLAQEHTELVCTMNLSLLRGVAERDASLTPRLDPAPGRCCVALERS